MAQEVQVVLVDDIDGGEADETVAFGLDNVSYEIDLSEDNAARLRDALAPFVGSARRVGGRATRGRRRPAAPRAARTDNASIRAWAREQGLAVSDRGRVPAEIVERFHAAH